MARTRKPSADDLAEVARGKGSARDKREAAAYRRLNKRHQRRNKR